uniref:Variant surface glycoprotein 1125.5718 n=1 Tax=Trypanosoma brucei TaxID=5691 RepID=A0A1J0RCT8_9TRYP|nr:variant surface glycoprotein 1125.5718 [Trypanosoma brucei]
MSTAKTEWRKIFPKEEKSGKLGPNSCQQNKSKPRCQPEWKQWAKDSIKAAAKGTRPNDIEVPTAKLESPEWRAAAIYELEQFEEQYKQDLTDVANKVKTEIGKAVYGSAYTLATVSPTCPKAAGDDWQTICKMPNVGAAMCHVLACLCSKNSDGTITNDVCVDPKTQSVTSTSPSGYITVAAELTKVCQKELPIKPTAACIRTRIAKIRSMLKTKGNAGSFGVVLGTIGGTADCKDIANTACADLTAAVATKGDTDVD